MKAGSKKPMGEKLSKYIVSASGCWEWTGAKDRDGYGRIRGSENGKPYFIFAHRASFEHHVRPLEEGEQVLHHCDNPCCISPEPGHIYPGNPQLNGQDKKDRGRARTSAKSGPENPMYGKTGAANPFFGKKHTQDSIEQMKRTKAERALAKKAARG